MGNYVQFWITLVSPNDTHLDVLGKSAMLACNRIFKGLNKSNFILLENRVKKKSPSELFISPK